MEYFFIVQKQKQKQRNKQETQHQQYQKQKKSVNFLRTVSISEKIEFSNI